MCLQIGTNDLEIFSQKGGVGPPAPRMRCDFCRHSNPPGTVWCQVCQARLPGVVCALCSFENPPGHIYCGSCGQSLTIEAEPEPQQLIGYEDVSTMAREEEGNIENYETDIAPQSKIQQAQGKDDEKWPLPLVTIVGFGAILAVATVAYPWYSLGDEDALQTSSASMFNQLETGWSWFPGVPIVLIILSATLSTFFSILTQHGKVSPVPLVFFGLVSLVSAIWLWQGLVYGKPIPSDGEIAPVLATIGAIIVLVGGTAMAGRLMSR